MSKLNAAKAQSIDESREELSESIGEVETTAEPPPSEARGRAEEPATADQDSSAETELLNGEDGNIAAETEKLDTGKAATSDTAGDHVEERHLAGKTKTRSILVPLGSPGRCLRWALPFMS